MIEKRRTTKETDIHLKLELYGTGKTNINTGVGFFDHMLDALGRHALLDLELSCRGDLQIDDHHTVEDVGIVLGEALGEAIYPVRGVERFGNAVVVMDEAAVSCDIDLSHRAYLVWDVPVEGKVGSFDCELAEEFFRALVFNLPITCHLVACRGRNRHHLLEASFKALALALRRATAPNERIGVPSTKGVL